MINKRWITLPVVYSRRFTSKAVFWAILEEFDFAVECSFYYKEQSTAKWGNITEVDISCIITSELCLVLDGKKVD